MADEQTKWTSTGSSAPGRGDDYDPESIPVRTAATVLILDERPDLHVLMLKRNSRSVFVGDMWVFPGGGVDADDATPEADALVAGRTDPACSMELALESGGIAYWVAVLRETFEEAGLLIAHDLSTGQLLDFRDPQIAERFEAHRDVVNNT
ncbi:NUDIX domain-containing protein, partial [Acidimicrobiaceae bacterium]|nr:NUDIX domain-containing protein [Acidimicrobiaceae bacterium]